MTASAAVAAQPSQRHEPAPRAAPSPGKRHDGAYQRGGVVRVVESESVADGAVACELWHGRLSATLCRRRCVALPPGGGATTNPLARRGGLRIPFLAPHLGNCLVADRNTVRRRYLPDIRSHNAVVRGVAERNAVNAPIQGTAADMIKIAMIRVYRELERRNLRSAIVLQVHDELVLDVFLPELDEVRELVRTAMLEALPIGVPVEVEVESGSNWLEAH